MLKQLPVLILLSCTACCLPSIAQSLRMFNTGLLQCGIVKRAADQVQTYCYNSQSKLLLHNTINTVYQPQSALDAAASNRSGLIVTYQYGLDNFAAFFNVQNSIIHYEVATNTVGFTGALVDVVGSIGLGCGRPKENPRFSWTADNLSCISTWIAPDWLSCCA